MNIVLFTFFLSLSLTKCKQNVRSWTLKYCCELKPFQHTLPAAHDNQARIPDLENHKASVTGTCFFLQSFFGNFTCPIQYAKLPQRIWTRDSKQIRPSFCSLANADNSVYAFSFLTTSIRHVHTKTFVFYDNYLCYFSARNLGCLLHCNPQRPEEPIPPDFRLNVVYWRTMPSQFREPITEIWVSRTFNKLLVLLGHFSFRH